MLRLVLTLTALAFSVAHADDQALNDLSVGNALGGPPILASIRQASVVTAQRVDSKLAETAASAPEKIDLIELGEPIPVPAAEADALKSALTRSATHLSPTKSCEFRANVRYGFPAETKDQNVDVILCFGCGEFEIRQGDKMVSFGPFDGGYADLLAITQRIFPDDKFLKEFSPESFQERTSRLLAPQP